MAKRTNKPEPSAVVADNSWTRKSFLIMAICLGAVLGVLFHKSMLPQYILFSNDGPLGADMANTMRFPSAFVSMWADLNSIGAPAGSFSLPVMGGFKWIFGPVGYAKVFGPGILFLLGCSVYLFTRQMKLSRPACIIAGIVAPLNAGFLSNVCWGSGQFAVTATMCFLALAAMVGSRGWDAWLRVPLTGLAVGMAVIEAADVGALFSIFMAGFIFYWSLISEGPVARKVTAGILRVAIVAFFAAFIAAQTVGVLIATNIKGVSSGQKTEDKEAVTSGFDYDKATQWSFPKVETFSLFVPGLFGYRMDTPDGGSYWGKIGRDAMWDKYFASGKQGPPPDAQQGIFLRYSGGGGYAGVMVIFIVVWTAIQAFRRNGTVFSLYQRKCLWFWIGGGVICLLLAYGHWAPFYRILYALPYASSVRNPAKFLLPLEFAILIIFGYGIDGLWRTYLQPAAVISGSGIADQYRKWKLKASVFDQRWIVGCMVAFVVSLVGWLIYGSSKDKLIAYLTEMGTYEGRRPEESAALAQSIASFSLAHVGWFLLFFALSIAVVNLIIIGFFAGRKAKLGICLLGLVAVLDLGKANLPWIIHWDYKAKYASNPVIDMLREKPYEHRVAELPSWFTRFPPQLYQQLGIDPQMEGFFRGIYGIEWKQHLQLYYNIQTIDIIQMPRVPADLAAFETALFPHSNEDAGTLTARKWMLTNTRYLLGSAGWVNLLNQMFDPVEHRFRLLTRFDLVPRPGTDGSRYYDFTTEIKPDGRLAVIEFTGALPRAKLYSNWQVQTNDQAVLGMLSSTNFNPTDTVLVSEPIPAPPATNAPAGDVSFTSYSTKDIVFKADSHGPSVLLLNDKYDGDWQVLVDGKKSELLRCNYIFRGVYLPAAGNHTVEFHYRPTMGRLPFLVVGVILAIVLTAVLVVASRRRDEEDGAAPVIGSPVKTQGAG